VEELLAWEGELTWREEALSAREDKASISEQALVQVSAALDAEQTKADAAREVYLDKMEAHTTLGRLILDLDKILAEKKVELDRKEWDLELRVAALAKAHAWGLNCQDNHDKLMEFFELWRLLWDIKADRAIKASRLAALVGDVS
jgi:hypothetical protein